MNKFSHVQMLVDISTSGGSTRRECKKICDTVNKVGLPLRTKFIPATQRMVDICEEHAQCGQVIMLVLVGKFQVPTMRFIPYNAKNGGTVWVYRTPRIGEEGTKIYRKTLSSFERSVGILERVLGYVLTGGCVSIPDSLTTGVTPVMYRADQWKKMAEDIIHDSENSKDPVCWLDFETTGLDPKVDRVVVTGMQIGHNPVRVLYSPDEDGPHINVLRMVFSNGKRGMGAFNAQFEHTFALEKTGMDVKILADGQVTHCMILEEDEHDLGQVACVSGFDGYDMVMDEYLKEIPYGKFRPVNRELRLRHHEAPEQILCGYNAEDVYVTRVTNDDMMVHIRTNEPVPDRQEKVIGWLLRGQQCLSRMHSRGFYLDKRRLYENNTRYHNRQDELRGRLVKFAAKNGVHDFNPGSPVQKTRLLYEVLKLPVMKTTNRDWIMSEDLIFDEEGNCHQWWDSDTNPSTDGDAMEWLYGHMTSKDMDGKYSSDEKSFVKDIMDYNVCTSLINGVLTHSIENMRMYPDNRGGTVHTNWSLTKLVTGQISSTKPPMQNVAKVDIRNQYTSRFKGGFVLEADYSQLHLRIIGNLAQCMGFIEAYAKGVDLHVRTTAGVLLKVSEEEVIRLLAEEDTVTIEARDKGKRVNFSIIFEIGPSSLAMAIQEPKEVARKYIKDWFLFYPEIREQIDRQHHFAEKHGYVISPTGRVRHLPGARSMDRSVKSRSLRQAGDFLISNSGRYITLYGMIMLDEMMISRKMNSMVVGQVHDSVIVDVHPKEVDYVQELVKECCVDRVMEEFGDWMDPIPLVMDGFYGPSWWKKEKGVTKFTL